MHNVQLEICVDTIDGASCAARAGADRIELCSALALGGLGPGPGLTEFAVATGVPVHAMVRPRAGDFVYTDDEVAAMCADIRDLAARGVRGVVFGATSHDGTLNVDAMKRLIEGAQGLQTTLHRAVDLAPDRLSAVETAALIGIDHILTSGGETNADSGAAAIAAMVRVAGDEVEIVAGSGVRPANVADIIKRTGVHAVHASASIARPWSDPRITAMGFASGDRRVTDEATITALKMAIATIAD